MASVASPADVDRIYRAWRVRVLASTMIGYATFYFVRSNMPIAQKALLDAFHFSKSDWGEMLSAATIVYGISKFLSGILADVFKPRYIMSLGLLVSALVSLIFGLGHSLAFFGVLWIVNNLFQGLGMTPCSRLITFWFSPKELGRAWGLWNASHQIGGAVILVAGGYLVAHYGWRSAFWAPGLFALVVALWLYWRLPFSPESMGLPPVEEWKGEAEPVTVAAPPKHFGHIFREHILRNPWVWIVSISNFFVYVVRIGVFAWGPTYLQEAKGFHIEGAAAITAVFEIVGMFGAFAAGWLSDRVFGGRRGPVSVGFMVLLAGAVFALYYVPARSTGLMMVVFGLLGFLVYGPQLLVAVAAADFATKQASASAVGLTGLFGYAGASACSAITGIVADRYGWNAVIAVYIASALLGATLLATTWRKRSPLLREL